MAVIAFAFAGQAIGAAVGGALGWSAAAIATAATVGGTILGAAGSYVDSTLLFPSIFGSNNQTISGPKIDDFQLTTATPGTPLHFCMGRENRVPGAFIWISKVTRVKEENEEGGGKGGGGTTVVTNKYYVSFAVALCEGPISSVPRIWADGKIIYDGRQDPPQKSKKYKGVTIYLGSTDQDPDPTIESFDGAGNVPGYRGIAYVVFERFSLTAFGNRMPNFSFEIEAQPQLLLSDAVSRIFARAGRPIDDIDTVWLRGEELRGYDIIGPQSPLKSMEPLMVAYGVVCQDIDGVLNFRKRKDVEVTTLPLHKLAAREEGQDVPRLMNVSVSPGFDLPEELDVQFLDPTRDLQKNSVRAKRQNAVAPTTSSYDLPIVLPQSLAYQIAYDALWQAWGERNTVEMTFPPSMLTVLESDALEFNDYLGNPWRVRVTNVTRGNNYMVNVKGVTEQKTTLGPPGAILDEPFAYLTPPVSLSDDTAPENSGGGVIDAPLPPPTPPVGGGTETTPATGDPLPTVLNPGDVLHLQRGAVYDLPNPIQLKGDGILIDAVGTGPRPVVRCQKGAFRAATTVTNLIIRGLRLSYLGNFTAQADDPPGIDIRQPYDNLLFEDLRVEKFQNCFSIHHPLLDNAPEGVWGTNVVFRRVQFIDPFSDEEYGGQGVFIANVDGLWFEDCWFDGCGYRSDRPFTIYRHGIYLNVNSKNVTITRTGFVRCSNYGCQCRGGADVTDCLFVDCGNACMINGPGSTNHSFTGNVIQSGHVFTDARNGGITWPFGGGGFDGHVEEVLVQNNLFVGRPIPTGYYQTPAVSDNPGVVVHGWEYTGSTHATTSGNLAVNWPGRVDSGNMTTATSTKLVTPAPALTTAWLDSKKALTDPTGAAAEGIALLRAACGL